MPLQENLGANWLPRSSWFMVSTKTNAPGFRYSHCAISTITRMGLLSAPTINPTRWIVLLLDALPSQTHCWYIIPGLRRTTSPTHTALTHINYSPLFSLSYKMMVVFSVTFSETIIRQWKRPTLLELG
jgi:hypothetical protein